MPVTRFHQSSNDSTYEARIVSAVEYLKNQKDPNVSEAARLYNVRRTTLSERFHGKHINRQDAAEKKRLLDKPQEEAILAWMDKSATEGLPYDSKSLRASAHDIAGKVPGKNWAAGRRRTNPEILQEIEDFLAANEHLIDNPRFSGLFGTGRRTTVATT